MADPSECGPNSISVMGNYYPLYINWRYFIPFFNFSLLTNKPDRAISNPRFTINSLLLNRSTLSNVCQNLKYLKLAAITRPLIILKARCYQRGNYDSIFNNILHISQPADHCRPLALQKFAVKIFLQLQLGTGKDWLEASQTNLHYH